MAEPHYALERVQEAARASQIELDIKRARSEVALQIEDLLEAYQFAARLLLELQPGDFCESVTLEPPQAGIYDVYGIQVSAALADKHGVRRCWYTKFKLVEEELTGNTVFFVSLHLLNFRMTRKGGVLAPE